MQKVLKTTRIMVTFYQQQECDQNIKQENSNFPSYANRNCVQMAPVVGRGKRGTITLFTKYTSNAPHLSWWQCRSDTTLTTTQEMYCIPTNCTRTAGPHMEMVINHSPNGLFPPWSEKVQHCAVSFMFLYPAIFITVSQLEAWWSTDSLTPHLFFQSPSAGLQFWSAAFLGLWHGATTALFRGAIPCVTFAPLGYLRGLFRQTVK